MSLLKAENIISGVYENDENEEEFPQLDPHKILGKVYFSKWRKKCIYNFF